MGFGGGHTPKVQVPAPPPPDRGSAAVEDAAQAERQRLANAGGRSKTLLSATSDTQQGSGAKTLLGS